MKWLDALAVALLGAVIGLISDLSGIPNHGELSLTSHNRVHSLHQGKSDREEEKSNLIEKKSYLKIQNKSLIIADSGWRNFSDKKEQADNRQITDISNRYIVLKGRLKGVSVGMFLAVKTIGETSQVRGGFTQKRNNISLELAGAVKDDMIVIRERIVKKDQVTLGDAWTLKERDDGSWIVFSPLGKIILYIDNSSVSKEFRFRNRDIHPQVIGYLFERVGGHPLLVNVRNYNNRPMVREGEWLIANLEYGYIRYRVVTNFDHSWILETERSRGRGEWSSHEIIHVVWIDGSLSLFRVIDQDHQSSGKIFDLGNEGIITYKKKVTGTDLINYLNDFESSFSPIMEKNEDNHETEWCKTCYQGVLTITYAVGNDIRRVVNLELLPRQSSQNYNSVDGVDNRIEISFQKTAMEYLNKGIRGFKGKEINLFINSWLRRVQ